MAGRCRLEPLQVRHIPLKIPRRTAHALATCNAPRRTRRHLLRSFAVATIAVGSIVGIGGLAAGSASASTLAPTTVGAPTTSAAGVGGIGLPAGGFNQFLNSPQPPTSTIAGQQSNPLAIQAATQSSVNQLLQQAAANQAAASKQGSTTVTKFGL
jgi:hypothetical protein